MLNYRHCSVQDKSTEQIKLMLVISAEKMLLCARYDYPIAITIWPLLQVTQKHIRSLVIMTATAQP